jgi:hypothetical protein
MKAILYAGAALMIGASIYGFVDYKSTQNKKEFKEMYAEPAQPAEDEVVAEEKQTDNKTVSAVSNAEIKENKELKNETAAKKKSTILNKKFKKTKKQRRLDVKDFGRGALDERYTERIKKPKAEIIEAKLEK